jgi:hypothetical protein
VISQIQSDETRSDTFSRCSTTTACLFSDRILSRMDSKRGNPVRLGIVGRRSGTFRCSRIAGAPSVRIIPQMLIRPTTAPSTLLFRVLRDAVAAFDGRLTPRFLQRNHKYGLSGWSGNAASVVAELTDSRGCLTVKPASVRMRACEPLEVQAARSTFSLLAGFRQQSAGSRFEAFSARRSHSNGDIRSSGIWSEIAYSLLRRA